LVKALSRRRIETLIRALVLPTVVATLGSLNSSLFNPVLVAWLPSHIGLARRLLLRSRKLVVWTSAAVSLRQRKAAKPKAHGNGQHNGGRFHFEAPSCE
jgi:hypothetical protein